MSKLPVTYIVLNYLKILNYSDEQAIINNDSLHACFTSVWNFAGVR